MKPFAMNERKKKWILTTGLVAVLGFSLSAPMKKEIGFAELASTREVKTDTIVRDGKKYEVSYIAEGDKTIAFIPVELEGKVCESAGECRSSRVLNVDFAANLKDLELALDAKLREARQVAPQPEEQERTQETAEEKRERLAAEKEEKKARAEEKKDEEDDKALQALLKKCDTKDEGKEHAKCLSQKLVELLKDRSRGSSRDKNRKIKADKIADFISNEMREEILDIVRTGSDGGEDRASSTGYQDVGEILRILQAGLRDNKKAREQVKDIAVEVARIYANRQKADRTAYEQANNLGNSLEQQAKALMQKADQTQDLSAKQLLMNQAAILTQQSMSSRQQAFQLMARADLGQSWINGTLMPNLLGNTELGLNQAVQIGSIDQGYASSLLSSLTAQTMNLLTSISTPGLTSTQVPGNVRTDGQRGSINSGGTTFGPSRQFNPNVTP